MSFPKFSSWSEGTRAKSGASLRIVSAPIDGFAGLHYPFEDFFASQFNSIIWVKLFSSISLR